MHAQLQALKEAAENNDPEFNKKLDNLIARTGAVANIQKTNQMQDLLEEGEEYTANRAQYKHQVKLL